MEKETSPIESLLKKTGDFLETKVELLKLQAGEKATGIGSSLVSAIILIIIVGIMLLTLNIGIALWIGELLGEVYFGFFIVSGFYLLVGLLMYAFRSQWLQKPFHDRLVKKMLNK